MTLLCEKGEESCWQSIREPCPASVQLSCVCKCTSSDCCSTAPVPGANQLCLAVPLEPFLYISSDSYWCCSATEKSSALSGASAHGCRRHLSWCECEHTHPSSTMSSCLSMCMSTNILKYDRLAVDMSSPHFHFSVSVVVFIRLASHISSVIYFGLHRNMPFIGLFCVGQGALTSQLADKLAACFLLMMRKSYCLLLNGV